MGVTTVDNGEVLRGNLALTSVHEVLQLLKEQRRTGELIVIKMPEEITARLIHHSGSLTQALIRDRSGREVLEEVLAWDKGVFRFEPKRVPVAPPEEPQEDKKPERSETMVQQRDTTAILADLIKVPGVQAAVVIGRDGFAIETTGSTATLDIDALGASLANAINSMEEMGQELKVDLFQDVFIEYRHAVILCRPVGDAIVALVTPDASKLGIVRHKIKPLVADLARFF